MMRIKALNLTFGQFKLALEEVAIQSHTVVGAVAVVVLAISIWAVM